MENILLLVRLQYSVHHLTYSYDNLRLQTLYEYFYFLPVTKNGDAAELKMHMGRHRSVFIPSAVVAKSALSSAADTCM
jgi:predicted component of viral defense system (DUF524 family)